MNKIGDFRTIYGNPIKCINPIDQAKLVRKISDTQFLEQWEVEYTNELGRLYVALVKKDDETTKVEDKSQMKLNIDMACLALKESEAEVQRLKTLLFQIIPEKRKERNG